MALTTPQLQALKQDITMTRAAVMWQGRTLLESWDIGEDDTLSRFYHQVAVPDFWVWKSSVTKAVLTNEVSPEGTTFTRVGNGFITRSVGEIMTWQDMFSMDGMVNPSQVNVRQAFADIFSGTGNAAANRTHLLHMCRRLANYAETLLATGTGSAAAPGTMPFEGLLTRLDVIDARGV